MYISIITVITKMTIQYGIYNTIERTPYCIYFVLNDV